MGYTSYIKDEEGKILVQEQDIKKRWMSYFHKLFNKEHKYFLNSNKLNAREDDQFFFYIT